MKKTVTHSRFVASPIIVLATALSSGCSSGPGRVQPPDIDAGDAAAEAIELYDKDGDGAIAGSELDAVPGIKAAMETIDVSPKDDKATEDEIAARIESWQETRIGVMTVSCTVTLDGRQVTDATVTFEPESFLGSNIQAGVADIGPGGGGTVTIPKDKRPATDTPPGVQLGFYRVRISKLANGQESIPAMYNKETTLGQQVAPDDPAVAGQRVRFALTSK